MVKNFNYNQVLHLDANQTVITTRSIIYSSQLNNEFLAMMNGDFVNEKLVKGSLVDNRGYSAEELEVISEVSAMQLSDNTITDSYDFYTYLDGIKLIALRIPEGVSYLKLVSEDHSQDSDTLDISSIASLNKLVLIVQSGEKVDNLSPIIHNNSLNPHRDLINRLMTSNDMEIRLSEDLIDDGYVNTATGVKLADTTIPYTIEESSKVSSFNGKITIVNKNYHE